MLHCVVFSWVLIVISVFAVVEGDIQNTVIMRSSCSYVYRDTALGTRFVIVVRWEDRGTLRMESRRKWLVDSGVQGTRGIPHIQSDAHPCDPRATAKLTTVSKEHKIAIQTKATNNRTNEHKHQSSRHINNSNSRCVYVIYCPLYKTIASTISYAVVSWRMQGHRPCRVIYV